MFFRGKDLTSLLVRHDADFTLAERTILLEYYSHHGRDLIEKNCCLQSNYPICSPCLYKFRLR